jgi:hypothetical protein
MFWPIWAIIKEFNIIPEEASKVYINAEFKLKECST